MPKAQLNAHVNTHFPDDDNTRGAPIEDLDIPDENINEFSQAAIDSKRATVDLWDEELELERKEKSRRDKGKGKEKAIELVEDNIETEEDWDNAYGDIDDEADFEINVPTPKTVAPTSKSAIHLTLNNVFKPVEQRYKNKQEKTWEDFIKEADEVDKNFRRPIKPGEAIEIDESDWGICLDDLDETQRMFSKSFQDLYHMH
jgi:hypothetical protein